ncbi:hypothetical protein, partial [Escherichia coli]|uniref:hypothetical protein n=1 Tax=Escherichia coli TaxID=562 RepID=UPI0034E3BA89
MLVFVPIPAAGSACKRIGGAFDPRMTPVSGNAALRSVTLGNLSFSVTPSEACMSLFRRKSLDSVTVHEAGRRLIPTLSWPHLIALGIGAI